MGLNTFISFVHEDACVARAVGDLLGQHGCNVFLTADEWALYAGEIWLDRIRRELSAAEIVIVLFSRRSVGRPWIHFEAGAAWLTDKMMIPVCIGSFMVEELPVPYSGIQAVALKDYGSIYYVLRSIHHRFARQGATTPPPPTPESCGALLTALGQYLDPEPSSQEAR